MRCQNKCGDGKCLSESDICDGKVDCGDRTDEQGCSGGGPNLQVRLRGVDGKPHMGWVEIRAFQHPWGGLCDDGFSIDEAHVICREAGEKSVHNPFD